MPSKTTRTGIRSLQVTDHKRGGTTSYDIKGQLEVEPSGDERETMESENNPAAGFGVKSTRGQFDVTVLDAGSLSITDVQGWEDITAVAVGANGKTYSCKGWQVGKVSLNMLDGGVPIQIQGVVSEQTYG